MATVPGRRRLRSAGRNYLVVPRHRLATYGRRAFAIAGLSAWNDLPDELRDISLFRTVFRSRLKTFFLLLLAHRAHQRCFIIMRYINLCLPLPLPSPFTISV